MEYRTIKWDRQQLYEAVWEKPAVRLAKEYGISDVALAKICKKLEVPKPGLGYWARKESGFKMKRPPLPIVKTSLIAISHVRLNPPDTPERIPEQFMSVLKPPRATASRHPAVKQTAQAFAKGGIDNYGRLGPSDWRLPRLHLRVTKPGLQRALRFMDGLLKILEANDMGIKVGTKDQAHIIQLQVDGEQIPVTLRENVRGRKRDLTIDERRNHERYPTIYPKTFRWTYDPTDRFVFEIESYSFARRMWSDTKNKKLEDFTEEIVFGLRAAAASEKQRRAEQEAERQRYEKEQGRRMKQQERINRLRTNLETWEEAERIRAYLSAVRKRVRNRAAEPKDESLISRFLAWAERYADSLDPTGNAAALDWTEEP